MTKDIKLDGVSYGTHLVQLFSDEKEFVDHMLLPKHAHHYPGLSKRELTDKYKLLFKLMGGVIVKPVKEKKSL